MDEIINRINEKLELINENYQLLKPFMKNHLKDIETYIIKVEKNQENAVKILNSNQLTLTAIANKLKMSRTTLYNHNQLLKRYINASESLILRENPLTLIEEQKNNINKLEDDIDMLCDRDITLEIQKHEIKELSNRLKEKTNEIKRLEKRNRELSSELYDLKYEQRRKSKNVLSLKNKKNKSKNGEV